MIINPYAFASGSSSVYWNPSDKSAGVDLASGNSQAGRNSLGTWADSSVRSVTSHDTTPVYAEALVDAILNASEIMFGVATSSASFGTFIGAGAGGWTMQNDGGGPSTLRLAGSAVASGLTEAGAGDRYKVAYDPPSGKIWLGRVGIGWYNSGDPAAGTNATATITANTPLYLALSMFSAGNFVTLKNNVGENSDAIPVGFSMWG